MPIEIIHERTAIKRNKPSRPCQELYENTLYLPEGCSVLDYGCGKGDDVAFLKEKGYEVYGYDPYFYPDEYTRRKYDLVMSNYVLCTIPDFADRTDVIQQMWNRVAPEGCMSISVKSKTEIETIRKDENWKRYCDGFVTSNKTFQRGFTHDDLLKLVMNLPSVAYIETPDTSSDILTVRVLKRKTPLPQDETLLWI